MLEKLKGYKTKILAAGTILITIAGMIDGSVSPAAGIAAIMTAIGTLAAREAGAEALKKVG